MPVDIDHPITIRLLATVEEYHQAEIAQRDIWGMSDPTEITPTTVLVTAQKNGGLVAGAFAESGQMVGFLFGFVGVTHGGKFKHCSHLMGVLPELRRQGLGEALKLFQRDYVIQQGLFDLVTWTFDPLESANATLNLVRLGGVARTYYENVYGELPDGLNRGLPSDRFEIEWWIKSRHVDTFIAGRDTPTRADLVRQGAYQVNVTQFSENGVLTPLNADLRQNAETLLVEVPAVFQSIKATSIEVAKAWRAHTAAIFKHYFGRGYAVGDFIREIEGDRRRNFYVLSHQISGIPASEILDAGDDNRNVFGH